MDLGIVVDVETTGFDFKKDKIIEIGILEFAVETGKPPMITEMYSALEDPGQEVPPEVVKLTGLNNELLAGKQIDWQIVKRFFDRAAIAVAHNANFDATFLQSRPELQPLNVHWACSCRHINWQSQGFKSLALNYLAADHGFVNPFAHRALFDCATTFRVVAPRLDELIARSYQRQFQVLAVGSAFEMKDKLKSKDYRWDSENRVWHKFVLESEIEDERRFLAQEVYRGPSGHQEVEIS